MYCIGKAALNPQGAGNGEGVAQTQQWQITQVKQFFLWLELHRISGFRISSLFYIRYPARKKWFKLKTEDKWDYNKTYTRTFSICRKYEWNSDQKFKRVLLILKVLRRKILYKLFSRIFGQFSIQCNPIFIIINLLLWKLCRNMVKLNLLWSCT